MASLHVHSLRCEYLTNPLGLGELRPRLSWKLSAVDPSRRGLKQSAYQIVVSSSPDRLRAGDGDLWDSGKVRSNRTTFIDYEGRELVSGQRVWWTVHVWDQNDARIDTAEPAWWEMGLLDSSEWKGKWIGPKVVGTADQEAPAPYLRKTFSLPKGKSIVSARLYATAMGLYEFHLNGKRVGDDFFTPLYTDYRKRVQYQAYDVTPLLRAGADNVAGAILGDGWFCGFMGGTQKRQYYGDRPRMLAQLVVRFTDGSTETIATNESWNTATGPILQSDFLNGEHYDARLELSGWNLPSYANQSAWQSMQVFDHPEISIVAMKGPTVRAVQEIRPIEIRRKDDKHIVDFGQNMVGVTRLQATGPAGQTITLRFAEMLDKDGNIYIENLRRAKQTDQYTLKGDPAGETFTPRFTFHGFRYAEVGNYPGELKADDLIGVVLHTDMEQTGEFECSDKLVNQLQHNIEWGQRGNFLDIPTDCPQRDERLGWTGDAQVFCRTAAFNFDVSGFFAKWTQDLRDAQASTGTFPSVVPDTLNKREGDGGPAWADAGVICPWTMWQAYGDRRLIEQHYESMKKFVDRLAEASRPFDLVRSHPKWDGWKGYGDWLSQDVKDLSDCFGGTQKELIGTAFTAFDAGLLSRMARALGHEADAARYAQLREEVVNSFRRNFVAPGDRLTSDTQTAYVLALHFELLEPSKRDAAIARLVQLIHEFGDRLTTGFVGTPYLNHVLTASGRLDVAYTLLVQKNWPSWLYAVTQGATTIWERWDGWTHDRGFQSPGMNSFNHYAYGAVGDWLYQVVAGINVDPERPGYEHVILRPQPGGPLTHAKATLETIRGKVVSGWRIDGGNLEYTIELPPNVTGTLTLPTSDADGVIESGNPAAKALGVKRVDGSTYELVSGRYTFKAPLK